MNTDNVKVTRPFGKKIREIHEGDTFNSAPKLVTLDMIQQFTQLTDDTNEIHKNEDYAKNTPAGTIVAPGLLSASIASGLGLSANWFKGLILLLTKSSYQFKAPVFPGDSLTLNMNVSRTLPFPGEEKGLVYCDIALKNQKGEQVMTGEWELLLED